MSIACNRLYDCTIIHEKKGQLLKQLEEFVFTFKLSNAQGTETVEAVIFNTDLCPYMRGQVRFGGEEILMGRIMPEDPAKPRGPQSFRLHYFKEELMDVVYEFTVVFDFAKLDQMKQDVEYLVENGHMSPVDDMEKRIQERQEGGRGQGQGQNR